MTESFRTIRAKCDTRQATLWDARWDPEQSTIPDHTFGGDSDA